jgi:hypothetical protein
VSVQPQIFLTSPGLPDSNELTKRGFGNKFSQIEWTVWEGALKMGSLKELCSIPVEVAEISFSQTTLWVLFVYLTPAIVGRSFIHVKRSFMPVKPEVICLKSADKILREHAKEQAASFHHGGCGDIACAPEWRRWLHSFFSEPFGCCVFLPSGDYI